MMNKELSQIVAASPKLQQAVAQMTQQLQAKNIDPKALQKLIAIFEFVMKKPSSYAKLRQTMIQQGMPAEMFPKEMRRAAIAVILSALYNLAQPQRPAFARGGLAAQGRNGDSMLAHVNPFEAEVLKHLGGSGTINPATGLPEYGFFDFITEPLKEIFSSPIVQVLAPLALDFFVPGAGSMLGSALGASAAWAPVLGGALISGAASAAGGGNFAQGALMGGMGAGLGQMAGAAIAPGMGEAGQAMLGGGLAGGVGGALSGKGFAQGALQGVAGQALSHYGSGMATTPGMQEGIKQGGQLYAGGASPMQALIGGAAAGMRAQRPSDQVAQQSSNNPLEQFESGKISAADFESQVNGTKPQGGLNLTKAAMMAPTVANLIGLIGAPPEAQQAVSSMSPQQKEYFNRPGVKWDWSAMQRDAGKSGLSLSDYMARNWGRVSGYAQGGSQQGQYVMPQAAPVNPAQPPQPPKFAQGGHFPGRPNGPLSSVPRFMSGGQGSGREDKIEALLSPDEYVMDAETTALLGDGSPKEGARRLDAMRQEIRKHKGKALSRGAISPNAKSPLAYLKGI